MARFIGIAGIGCSGTSAIAGVLHKLGCPMHLPDHSNTREEDGVGYYEDACFYGKFPDNLSPDTYQEMGQLLLQHRQEPIWGLKNTLLGRALPWLVPLIMDIGDNPRLIVVHRTLTASIKGRIAGRCPYGQPKPEPEAIMWAVKAKRDLLDALHTLYLMQTPIQITHIAFEDIITDPEARIASLTEFAFAGLEPPSAEQVAAAVAHIKPELKHN